MRRIDSELFSLLEAVAAFARKDCFEFTDLEKVTTLYNQAAYLLTYVEGNAKYVTMSVPSLVNSTLLYDVELRGCLASRVHELTTQVDVVSRRWSRAIQWFLQSTEEIRAEAKLRAAMDAVHEALTRIDRDRAELLMRLGVGDVVGGNADTLKVVLRRVSDPATRTKLLVAWHRVGETHGGSLAAAMDRLVRQRWCQAEALGHHSVAERGFNSCRVSAETVRFFLDAFTNHAVRERRRFLTRFEGASGFDDSIRAMQLPTKRAASGALDPIELDALLQFISETVQRVFGINMEARTEGVGTVEGFEFTREGIYLGSLALDRALAGANAREFASEVEPTVSNHPNARVLCLMSSDKTVSLASAQQILHGMGHALVHIVTRPCMPSSSGLDFLPLERLEGLSHWFEEQIDKDVFRKRVTDTREKRSSLEAFRVVRDDYARNTRLEQAVVAAIDLDIHQRPGYGVRDAFNSQIERMGGLAGVSFERVVRFMTAPLFRDHPGMGFVYPWGIAFGATEARTANSQESSERSLFSYFDIAAASAVPDAASTFSTSQHPRENRLPHKEELPP